MLLSAFFPDKKIIPYETVFIFDEIQECANARSSIKAFMIDQRYDIIATGSLLGIHGYNKKNDKGIPVGFEKTIYMSSMDFEEFLWAIGIKKEITLKIKKSFDELIPIQNELHSLLLNYFKQYICVGGMPEVVSKFVETHNMSDVYNTQRDILESYKDDFARHLDEYEGEYKDERLFVRILEVFESIPSQLAKENKKFQYSLLKTSGRSSDYKEAIEWLKEYGILDLCYNLSNLELPLEVSKINDIFKIYMFDSGLFVAMLEKGTVKDILTGNLGIYKGAIYENIVADAFIKNQKKLYYFSKSSGLEIDFITRYKNECILVEVKATSGRCKSSRTILNDKVHYNINTCMKFSEANVSYNDNIINFPYYMAYLLIDDNNDIVVEF